MQPVCYFTISLGLLVALYEYQRVTSMEFTAIFKRPDALQILSTQLLGLFTQFFQPTWSSLRILLGYFGWMYALTFLVPGYKFTGPPIRDGRIIQFTINGLRLLWLTIGAYCGLCYYGFMKWTVAYANFAGLFFWCNAISLMTSGYLYLRGRARGLSCGHSFYEDFVMGQELVPEVLGLKLNFFWLRPSMMGWLFLNLSFLAKHYEVNGGHVSHSMLLYQIFTNAYVLDYFIFEEFVTSTWDIIAEKFGLMLVWGDLVFIPFTFTIQAWYLISDKTYYTPLQFTALCALFLTGYIVFRFANKQKHDFKKDPSGLVWGRKPEVLGGRLLVSGWWGLASHINYLGDLILAVSYAAPCGIFRTGSFFPWFYPAYLLILLIHRDMRDDAKCQKKYGKLWMQYRERVPYRILPYVY